jgi:hypothetical protein
MPFVKLHPKSKVRGFYELLWSDCGTFHCLPDDIYIVNDHHIALLDEKGIKYTHLGSGVLRLNGKRKSAATKKPQRKRAKAVAK